MSEINETPMPPPEPPEPPELSYNHRDMNLDEIQSLQEEHGIETNSLGEWDSDSVPDKPYIENETNEYVQEYQFAEGFDENTFNQAYNDVNQPLEDAYNVQLDGWVETENIYEDWLDGQETSSNDESDGAEVLELPTEDDVLPESEIVDDDMPKEVAEATDAFVSAAGDLVETTGEFVDNIGTITGAWDTNLSDIAKTARTVFDAMKH
jgi:hypothetical protein